MTKNQLEYWNMVSNNQIKQRELDEARRANKVRETYQAMQHGETVRSNLAKERETARSNLAKEVETNRANLAREAETNRSNLANEAAATERNRISLLTTQEQARHNAAQESEARRSNLVTEQLTSERQAETARANKAGEALGYSNLGEVAAHNREQEVISAKNAEISNTEAITHRYVQEQNKQAQAYDYAVRRAQIAETERHNRATEAIQRSQTTVNAATSILSTIGNVVSRGVSGLLSSRRSSK